MSSSHKKLLGSKWTAVLPMNREKHFIIVKVLHDETNPQIVTEVTIEAVLTKRHQTLHWRELADDSRWRAGWL